MPENGRPREVAAFSEGRRIDFPAPLGSRTAYLFPWPDVAYYPKTLGVKAALGRFALDPAWAGRLARVLVGTRMRGWLGRPGVLQRTHRALERLARLRAGHDRFALVVTAEGGGRVARASLAGRRQADATAAAAAELCRALAAHEIADAGVWLPEQIVPYERFFEALAALGWRAEMAP
jgi:short subunit dehydrogenase-like uncharacterized protein